MPSPRTLAKVLGDGIYQMTDGSVVAHLAITFHVNSTEMTEEGLDQAKQIALGLSKADGSEKFTIEGHASSEGDSTLNQSLSAARAAALRDYLASMGVPASIFQVRGFGESNLVIENGVENKEKSRRATLVRRQ